MIYPDFYHKFECKAASCNHSCCKGWEIDVDDDTCGFYGTMPGDIGDELAAAVYRDEDGAHFRLTEDERCPFLRDDGLCRVILSLGEEALCDICALHPRFYEDYGDMELAGLGLSCERVCELLWEEKAPLRFMDDEGREFSFWDPDFSYYPGTDESYIRKLIALFKKTEPIDDDWGRMLDAMETDIKKLTRRAKNYSNTYDSARYDRLFSYIMYRQLEKAANDADIIKAYAKTATDFIFIMDVYTGDTLESIRRFSEQIEYSTENVDIIIGI